MRDEIVWGDPPLLFAHQLKDKDLYVVEMFAEGRAFGGDEHAGADGMRWKPQVMDKVIDEGLHGARPSRDVVHEQALAFLDGIEALSAAYITGLQVALFIFKVGRDVASVRPEQTLK
jgi:hypothetical protein